jgi:hypothetical protein
VLEHKKYKNEARSDNSVQIRSHDKALGGPFNTQHNDMLIASACLVKYLLKATPPLPPPLPPSTLFLRCGQPNLIDIETKYYKDRRGLEQEEVEAFIIRVNACGDSQYCSSFLVLTISHLLLKDE